MPAILTAGVLGLPSVTAVPASKGRLPKEAFYQGLEITAGLKRQFVDDIESLTMLAVIRSKETGIPEGRHVREISVIEVKLKGERLPSAVLERFSRFRDDMTHHAVKVLYVIPDGTGYKTAVFRNANVNAGIHEGRLYVSDPRSLDGSGIRLVGSNLEQVWDSLCSQTVLNDETCGNVDQRIAVRERIMRLSAEQQRLETAHAKARQISRRNELWNQLREVTEELHRLQGEQQ
ncbi:DUF4391 domain-containing protein [Bifidobacterium longum]|uniref:DUF4391 domain-containing protein n=1 Tax=Bifidobacterium longum TaxID=216816 RepID=UPI0019269E7E|nr:DUF4391 domain-containing protein [Bifidobacterium longum]MBL3896334.1 DUF4391 domain-containing protein [Bifidobacterium longum subsp. suis]HJB04934.1 DUF4391 domain-containing protein [Candidatus Merdibacter merdigallinarum]